MSVMIAGIFSKCVFLKNVLYLIFLVVFLVLVKWRKHRVISRSTIYEERAGRGRSRFDSNWSSSAFAPRPPCPARIPPWNTDVKSWRVTTSLVARDVYRIRYDFDTKQHIGDFCLVGVAGLARATMSWVDVVYMVWIDRPMCLSRHKSCTHFEQDAARKVTPLVHRPRFGYQAIV